MKEYTYNIIDDVYHWMISKKKNIEVRILKEKSSAIQVGDFITFSNQDNPNQYVRVKVINKTIVDNIDELLSKFDVNRMMPDHTEEELKTLMKKIYGQELDSKQIVAFEFVYLISSNDVEIIEYEDKYLEDVRDLLVELEEYILSIDKDNLDTLHPEYKEKMALIDLEEVSNYNGKCYLAIKDNHAIGLIMGNIPPYDEYDYLDYKCPPRGEITELIVSNQVQNTGIGNLLINKIESYFKTQGCEYVIVDVFAYNNAGINFYNKKGYHSRMETMIKKI